MIVIRPITQNDIQAFIDIAFTAGLGMTSMPRNIPQLEQIVTHSIDSFEKKIKTPEDEKYVFVMEDLKTGVIGGTCAILAKAKHVNPVCYYRIEQTPHFTREGPGSEQMMPMLRPVHYYEVPSEICSLYLLSQFRRSGNGRLLSLCRFLFIAANPNRFDKMLFANMRGYISKDKVSHFWEGIGCHFLNRELKAVMHMHDEGTLDVRAAVAEYPIYVKLLPEQVQNAIGKVHQDTRPAINMLMQEGFILTDEIDVFDGGPVLEAETSEVRTIKSSVVTKVAEISLEPLEGIPYIISNNRLQFRACYGVIQPKFNQGVCIDTETANALQVEIGDTIRYITPVGEALKEHNEH